MSDQDVLVKKVTTLEDTLNSRIFERNHEIKTAIVALVARKNHFQLGPKGIAKSLLVRELFGYIDGLDPHHLFQILLTPFTTPDELFGLPSIRAMDEEDKYRRNTEYKLPEARIAFLDEIFHAGSATINTLLTIANEGIFFNGGPPEKVDLCSIFGASNVEPTSSDMEAFYDRLHFRHAVVGLRSRVNFEKMITFKRTPPVPVIHWDDIVFAQGLVDEVEVPDRVVETLINIRHELATNHIDVSDRRYVDCMDIVKAAALLDGRMVADGDDLHLLQHVLWTRKDDIRLVSQTVLEYANPLDKQAMDLGNDVQELADKLEVANTNIDSGRLLAKAARETVSKLKDAKRSAKLLREQAIEVGKRTTEIDLVLTKIDTTGKRVEEIIGAIS